MNLQIRTFNGSVDLPSEDLEGNILDMKLCHFNGINSENKVSLLLLRKFGFLKTVDSGFNKIGRAVFECFVNLVDVAEVLPGFSLASKTKSLLDLIQVGEKFVQFFTLLCSLVKLLEESTRLLSHDGVVTLKCCNWGKVIDQVWKC